MKQLTTSNNLRIVSYNCKNLKTALLDVIGLCNEFNIILLQETWLGHDDSSMLGVISNCFYGMGCSFMNNNGVMIRPFGGPSVLWKKSLNWSSVDVELLTDRIMCCKFTCNNRCLNIVNVYCPCAELINDRIADYLSVLNDVSRC